MAVGVDVTLAVEVTSAVGVAVGVTDTSGFGSLVLGGFTLGSGPGPGSGGWVVVTRQPTARGAARRRAGSRERTRPFYRDAGRRASSWQNRPPFLRYRAGDAT